MRRALRYLGTDTGDRRRQPSVSTPGFNVIPPSTQMLAPWMHSESSLASRICHSEENWVPASHCFREIGLPRSDANRPMTNYQPTSRRPIADAFRATAHGAVRWCVRWGVQADAVSCFSMVAAGGAAVCFWKSAAHPWLLILGPALCYLRLWCNMLDGMVALASGKASLRGEILNDLPDRFSDIVIFVGVAHSGWCAVVSGYWAALLAVLTAYVGTLGQAVGTRREFGGIMAKPWRMVTLHVGAWIALALLWRGEGIARFSGLTVLDWTCVVIIAGCVQTVWVRLSRIMEALRTKAGKQP